MKKEEFIKIQEELNLNNYELANKLGVSISLIEKIRVGKKIITNRTSKHLKLLKL